MLLSSKRLNLSFSEGAGPSCTLAQGAAGLGGGCLGDRGRFRGEEGSKLPIGLPAHFGFTTELTPFSTSRLSLDWHGIVSPSLSSKLATNPIGISDRGHLPAIETEVVWLPVYLCPSHCPANTPAPGCLAAAA